MTEADPALGPRPTLTETAESPPADAPRPGNILVTIGIWALLMAIPAALLGGGGWLLYQRAVGTWVEATVLGCDTRRVGGSYRTDCTAEWTDGGRTVVGVFVGGNGESDVGKTVSATVRGDTAYSRSLGLPVLLIVLGLPFLALPVLAIRGRRGGSGAGAREGPSEGASG